MTVQSQTTIEILGASAAESMSAMSFTIYSVPA